MRMLHGMSTTAARRRVIRNLILDQAVSSQAELVELLEARGMSVTQATVSRDLAVAIMSALSPSGACST